MHINCLDFVNSDIVAMIGTSDQSSSYSNSNQPAIYTDDAMLYSQPSFVLAPIAVQEGKRHAHPSSALQASRTHNNVKSEPSRQWHWHSVFTNQVG